MPVIAVLAALLGACNKRPAEAPPEALRAESAFSAMAEMRPEPRDTVRAIRDSGELRVLLRGDDAESIPRQGSRAAADRKSARAFADELGVRLRFVIVPEEANPYRALLAGLGDLLLPETCLCRAPPADARFSAPVRHVDEVVVVAKGAVAVPRSPGDLAGRTLHLKKFSRFRPAVDGLKLPADEPVTVALVPESDDTFDVLQRIGTGAFDATVVLRHEVDEYLSFADDVQIAFPLRADAPVAWAARAAAAELIEVVNGRIYGEAMTQHRSDRYAADLTEIKKRRVLRVGMLNNAASYFIYRGQEAGFQYELATLVAARLAVRLEVVIPERPRDMTRLLEDGRVDLIPVALSGAERTKTVAYTEPLSFAEHVLVQRAGAPPVTGLEQLAGKRVHVRASSTYLPRLQEVAIEVPELEIVLASEDLETEDLIAMVGRGEIPMTVSNSILLGVERTFRDDVRGTLVLSRSRPLVYGVRSSAVKLLARMNALIERDRGRPEFQALQDKYFNNPERMAEVRSEVASESGRISPYDELARKFGRRYNIDWRLVLAQMYQESRFDPKARSWAGAVGLMQVMPRTGEDLGFRNLDDPEANVHAGVKYLAWLVTQTEAELPMRQRVRFALAGYNAGMGHVKDARILARRLGLDANRWFGNVEEAILLLEKPAYHCRARRGYCRGSEPKAYVSRIQSKYDAYVSLMPAVGASGD